MFNMSLSPKGVIWEFPGNNIPEKHPAPQGNFSGPANSPASGYVRVGQDSPPFSLCL